MVKISVVMAAYNRAAEIGEAIDSVLRQEFQDFELIVVDDGSTDATKDVVLGYGDRVRYLGKSNGGPAAARNAGIRAAHGEYIAWADADDVQHPYRLGVQAAALDQFPNVAMVFGDFEEWIDRVVVRDSVLRTRWLGPDADSFEQALTHWFEHPPSCRALGLAVPPAYSERNVYQGRMDTWLCGAHVSWGCVQMCRADALREVGGCWEGLRAYEDYVLTAQMSKRWPLMYLDVPLCLYRVHPDQLTGRARLNGESYRDAVLHVWKSDPIFYQKHRERVDRALGTAYAALGELDARDGRWAEAEENFRRAILEYPRVGRRPYVNWLLSAVKHRVPLARWGLLDRVWPGFIGMTVNRNQRPEK